MKDRKPVSLSLNVEQQEKLAAAMEHMGVSKATVLYNILLERYCNENNLTMKQTDSKIYIRD